MRALAARKREHHPLASRYDVRSTGRQSAGQIDVGEYDFVAIPAANPADTGEPPYRALSAVAAGHSRDTQLLRAGRRAEHRPRAVPDYGEIHQLGATFDVDASLGKRPGQHPLTLPLGQQGQCGEGGVAQGQLGQRDRYRAPTQVQLRGFRGSRAGHQLVGDPKWP